MASVGPEESVGGDIKFLRLKQREIGGLVTDGSVRDTDEIINYGFPVSCMVLIFFFKIQYFGRSQLWQCAVYDYLLFERFPLFSDLCVNYSIFTHKCLSILSIRPVLFSFHNCSSGTCCDATVGVQWCR